MLPEFREGCNYKRPCRRHRECGYCARLRQAHFADQVQALLGQYNSLYLSRYTPYIQTQAEIERVKAAWKRQINHLAAAWSVEQGSIKGLLHLNIITPATAPKAIKACDQWHSERILDLRRAAAYIVKPDQYPDKSIYQGRQFGTFGNIAEVLINSKTTPLLTAAAHELTTLKHSPIPTPYLERQQELNAIRKSKGEYAASAAKHLPRLHAIVASIKGRD